MLWIVFACGTRENKLSDILQYVLIFLIFCSLFVPLGSFEDDLCLRVCEFYRCSPSTKEIPRLALAMLSRHEFENLSLSSQVLLFFFLFPFFISLPSLYFYRFCNHLAREYCEPDACSISFSVFFFFFITLFTLFFVTHVLVQTQISLQTRRFFSFFLSLSHETSSILSTPLHP